jgi:glycogen synthase
MNADFRDSVQAPKRVLMTTDAVGGVWQYSLHLARHLVERGSEILLVSLGPRPGEDQKQQVRAIPGLRLLETDFALEWTPQPWEAIDRSSEWLLLLENDFRPEVIHLSGYSYGALAWQAPALVVAHSCVYSWWRAVRGDSPSADWQEYKTRVARGLEACSAVVAPSGYMADAIASEYGIARERIEVIYNSQPTTVNCEALKEPFALAAGRFWDPAKNLELLDSIAPRVQWQIRIAGRAGSEPAESSGSGLATRYLGILPHKELLRQLQGASLFLHPALYEPFGLAVLEAASAECCLALSDIPSLREIWQGAAVFIDPHDPEQWIFEVNKLATDSGLRESLAQAARLRSRRYRSSDMLRRYLRLYEALREGTRKGANGVAA